MSKFDDALGVLLMGQPFFSTLLLKMEHVEDKTIPTALVNRTQLRYNPEFFDKLDLDEVVFVLAHEVMHQAWQHLPRMEYYLKAGVGPDGKPLNVRKYNMALDYPINHSLVIDKVGKPVSKDKFEMCLDPQNYPSTLTPEEVYCKMPDPPKNGSGPGPLDEHDALTNSNQPDAITPADVLQAAETHKRIKGEYPAGMDRLLGEIRKPDQSPWRVLRAFVTKNMPGYDATTWRRLQRRMAVRGIGMPTRVAHGAGRVGVVVDTSGSIGEEMLTLFGSHLAAIIADARPEAVEVIWTDAAVHRVDTVKTATELRALLTKPVPGGGGTDMPVGIRCAEELKCDAIVCLTDGYTGFCDSKKPLLWAITSHNIQASGNGRTIHI